MTHGTSRSPLYLVRNRYSYCFRLKIPQDIQVIIGKKELRYSLKTGYLSEAKRKARYLAGNIQHLFNCIRKGGSTLGKLTEDQVKASIKKYMEDLIRQYDKSTPPISLETVAPPFIDHATFSSYIDDLQATQSEYRINLGMGDYSDVEKKAEKILKENGVQEIDRSSELYCMLCAGLMRSEINGIEYHKEQLTGTKGNYDQTFSDIIVPQKDRQRFAKEPAAKVETRLISEIIPLFVSEAKINWSPKTQAEVEAGLALFLEIHGDRPIQSITRKAMSDYKHTLMRLPPNMRKDKRYRNKTIQEILEMKVEKTLSVARINIILQRASALMQYACVNGYYEGSNPATGIQLPKNRKDRDLRAAYTNTEIERLLKSDQYINNKFRHSYQYWTPIIALFHGMRVNEIASLFLEDIKKSDDGVWIFDLTGRNLKTAAAQRVIPIHPFVYRDLDLIGYTKRLRQKGEKQLFPELKKTRDGYARAVSSWFNMAYKISCNIKSDDGRKRDFHSFRATYITHLRHKRVNDRALKEVVGHAIGNDTTDIYTECTPPKILFKEITKKVSFDKDIDLTHLIKGRFVAK